MKTMIQAAAVVLLAASTAHAQQALQWRVEDGGNGHWYEAARAGDYITWSQAQGACVAKGAALASLSTQAESDWAYAAIASDPRFWTNNGQFIVGPWIGGRGPLGNWRWDDGSPWTFAAWHPGEGPPSTDPVEQFAHYFAGVGPVVPANAWGDYFDVLVTPSYLAEWSADCNNDGIVDYGQCRDGSLPDYNGNNTPDCCERGEACVVGNYPVQWRTEEGGNGHWYELSLIPRTWPAARDAAASVGGHLVTITNQQEQDFVTSRQQWREVTFWGVWMGAHRDGCSWSWLTGEPWGFAPWAPNEPNGGCIPAYLLLYVQLGSENQFRWDDCICPPDGIPTGSVIEWSADCNADGIVDYGQILDGTFDDANRNGIPDRVCECLGDFDADGAITGADLGQLLAAWGASAPGAPADLNADGAIDGFDLAYLLAGWGQCQN